MLSETGWNYINAERARIDKSVLLYQYIEALSRCLKLEKYVIEKAGKAYYVVSHLKLILLFLNGNYYEARNMLDDLRGQVKASKQLDKASNLRAYLNKQTDLMELIIGLILNVEDMSLIEKINCQTFEIDEYVESFLWFTPLYYSKLLRELYDYYEYHNETPFTREKLDEICAVLDQLHIEVSPKELTNEEKEARKKGLLTLD